MSQKLVTVFVHDNTNKGKSVYGDPGAGEFFGVKEHLQSHLSEGWRIKEFKILGGAGGCLSGWIVVLLEK